MHFDCGFLCRIDDGHPDLDLSVLQSLSAHLKLLLDAPEQLWRLLEKHNYLHAAWLFLISRVVYRSLMQGESQDDEDIEHPWAESDIVVSVGVDLARVQGLPFIKHVGTISASSATMGYNKPIPNTNFTQGYSELANNQSNAPSEWLECDKECISFAIYLFQETCDTLVSILLLDSIPASEIVTLLLSQRSKALRTLLSKLTPTIKSPSGLRSSSSLSPDRLQNRQTASTLLKPRAPSLARPHGVSASTRLAQKTRKETVLGAKDTLKQALDLIVGTVETMRAIFGGNREPSNGTIPLVQRILESVQSISAEVTPPPRKRSRHAHSMSVISSFHATPAPIPSNNPSQPLTSTIILDSLPSSQLLLQFLPASIVSYSPYIDIASAKAQLSSNVISTATAAWFDASLASLRSNIGAWFDCLDNIRSVWQVRSVLDHYKRRLNANELSSLVAVVDEACANRARSVWSASLQGIVHTAERAIEGATHSILQNDEVAANSAPARFSSSQIPLPSFTQSGPKEDTFVAYKAALQRRIVMRDPLLDQIIIALEGEAYRTKKDFCFILKDESARYVGFQYIRPFLVQGPQPVLELQSSGLYLIIGVRAAGRADRIGSCSAHQCSVEECRIERGRSILGAPFGTAK